MATTLQNEVAKAMEKSGNDKILAASLSGIGRTTLYRKLEEGILSGMS